MIRNRVQLSLILDDDEVYNNLIIPAKHGKELHPLCIRLLTAYYYNEQVRELVDGVSEYQVEGEQDNSIEDAIASIRSNLAMQSFLQSDLAQLLEDGANDIANIANGAVVNVADEEKGVQAEFSKNSAGNTSVRLITKNGDEVKPNITPKATETNNQEQEAITLIKYMARVLNIDLSGAYKDASSETNTESKAETEIKNEIQTPTQEVPIEELVIEEDLTEESSEPENNVQVENNNISVIDNIDESVSEEVINDNTIDEDAADSMSELLGSIL